MTIKKYIPTIELIPFVRSILVINSQEGQINRVLPDTAFAMAFRIRGEVAYIEGTENQLLPSMTISGMRNAFRLIGYAPKTTTIIVLFKQSGISAFYKPEMHELYNHSTSLDTYFAQTDLSILDEQLQSVSDHSRQIKAIEQFLISKLIVRKQDPLVTEAIAKIDQANGHIRIKELIKDLYISQDAFEKRFRKTTGATPKQFSQIIKMQAVISQYQKNPAILDIAFENGFYDQPHFNRTFKTFTGQAPTEFFKTARYW
ncbi:helix-turn-helix domain-containing protein [Arachidicoccus terrestris]|uniref:helix-turn-helix domain-containing protein n=1 Tax=Arachidicoccus terrestris TaxID=2875539 RepID=UPI001CC78E49|nr:helix-turn-helix transcriptional regulator [Arachidicoccus terrestris]UAY54971.1 helix-turn-helix transcriptional regulator [Arachidicoccus terrestris]